MSKDLVLQQHGFGCGVACVAMYTVVWVAHFLIEKNKPATWKHPLWSFISDFRMTYLFFVGKLP